jgi:protein TonB
LLLALFFVPGPWHSSRRIPQTSAEADSLNLRVEHSGADLLLTWNRDAAPIQNAGRAVLSIADGDRQEGYVMDLAQLRTGSIVYAPLSSDVSFRLDLTQHDRRTVVGTVRMLRTRPSPMPTDSQPETVVKAKPEPAHPAESNDSAPADASETESPAPVMAAAPIKPFDASSLAARLHPARPAEQPDAPSLGGGVPVSPRVITDTPLPFATPAMAPPPPPAASPAAAPEHTAAESLGMGGHIQQAELLSRREPVYPALARQMGARGVVELIASIGADGRVKAVRVVRGQPVLAKAASDAVMQWVYRPTMLNGIAVPNETRITLNFLGK